jgi:hypothetical protein
MHLTAVMQGLQFDGRRDFRTVVDLDDETVGDERGIDQPGRVMRLP